MFGQISAKVWVTLEQSKRGVFSESQIFILSWPFTFRDSLTMVDINLAVSVTTFSADNSQLHDNLW